MDGSKGRHFSAVSGSATGLAGKLSAMFAIALSAAVVVLVAVGFAVWSRVVSGARMDAALRDLAGGFGAADELAASLDPEVVAERVLAAAAALPGIDAALLI